MDTLRSESREVYQEDIVIDWDNQAVMDSVKVIGKVVWWWWFICDLVIFWGGLGVVLKLVKLSDDYKWRKQYLK